jgi:hypothetical protein
VLYSKIRKIKKKKIQGGVLDFPNFPNFFPIFVNFFLKNRQKSHCHPRPATPGHNHRAPGANGVHTAMGGGIT